MEERIKSKLASLAVKTTFDAPLAELTTFRLGGAASALVEPDGVEELAEVMSVIRSEGLPWFVMSGGSNVLFHDEGFRGVVIRLGPGLSGLKVLEKDSQRGVVEAGASVVMADLVALCRKEGLSGLEMMAGIPGRVGGALSMNAGAWGRGISEALIRLEVLTPEGRPATWAREDLHPLYRDMNLPAGTIIIKGVFGLDVSTPEAVGEAVDRILEQREGRHPSGVMCAGSVFRNPSRENPAGKLIDQAGLKGRSVGGAWVSEVHGNFIVHRGEAASSDVLALMEIVKAAVAESCGIDLIPEVVVVDPDGRGTGDEKEQANN